jgi:hypothetical protein
MWKVVTMPGWLALDTARLETSGMYISQNNSYNIPLKILPGKNTGTMQQFRKRFILSVSPIPRGIQCLANIILLAFS